MIDKWMDEMMGDPEPLNELEQKRIMSKVMMQVEAECHKTTDASVASKRKPHRWRRSAAVACAAVMVLSAGVFGATMMEGGLSDLLGGGTDRGKEIVSEMGTIFTGQSQSVNGYTVTLNQMIHDRNGCYVLFQVSQDDDMALDEGYYYFARTTVGIPDTTRSGWYVDQPEIHDGKGDTVSMILHYDADETVAGKTLRIQFEDFGFLTEDGEYVVLGEGQWIFEIPVEKEDHTQTFRLNQEVTFKRGEEDKTITVETLYLSPMSLVMAVSDNYSSTDQRELIVKLEDGSILEFSGGGYGSGGPKLFGSNTQVDVLFDHVIDPKTITEIWFNGTKLEF